MTDPNWDEKAVFSHALELPADQREAYLNEACPDEAAKNRVRALLRHHGQAPDELFDVKSEREITEVDPTQIAEFKIIRRLGAGGMGVVYLAEDTVLGRRVALKVLARHMTGSEQALARFREEARSTAVLNHPAIVPVYKFDREGDHHYIVSEFVEGITLAELIARRRAAPTLKSQDIREWHRQAAEIVAAVADGLDSAHRFHIVHRDVKPSNILIDTQGRPRLTDFGIAKHLTEESRIDQTQIIGSCHYMSPEQASVAGTRVDQRSDIFSLGVVLYEMLALQLPFDGPTLPQVLRAVVDCNPEKLRSVDKKIPRDLETICQKAMEKEPRHRYQTAAHVAADLRCFLTGDPILARPPNPIRRVRQKLRAHRGKSVAAVVLLLCAVVFTLIVQVRNSRNAELAWLSVESESPGMRVTIRAMNTSTLKLEGSAIELGRTPLAEVAVEPGQYRLAVASPTDSSFCEFDLDLARGRENQLVIHVHGATRTDLNQLYPKTPDLNSSRASGRLVAIGARLIPAEDQTLKDMVRFAEGDYEVGWSDADDNPVIRKQIVHLDPFYLDVSEVSNREYQEFITATGYPPPSAWKHIDDEDQFADQPVVTVSIVDAMAYAAWRNKRLPTAFEWEAAARASDNRLLPWGDAPPPPELQVLDADAIDRSRSPDLVTCLREYTRYARPVRSDISLSTPTGLFHMATNVTELTSTVTADATPIAVRKGGAWFDSRNSFNLSKSLGAPAFSHSSFVGFRCARSERP